MNVPRPTSLRAAAWMLPWVTLLASCVSELPDDSAVANRAELVVAESAGTGTTGGNPSSSLVVHVDVPASESLDIEWDPPTLSFDRLRIRRLDNDGSCRLERILHVPEVELRMTASTKLAFLRDDVCEVGVQRDTGPVLHLAGTNAIGQVVDVALAEGAELVMDVTQWRAVRQRGGVLSVRPRRLLVGVPGVEDMDPLSAGVMLSDMDAVTGPLLRQNLGDAVGGYIDLNLDGNLGADELVPEARFLGLRILNAVHTAD